MRNLSKLIRHLVLNFSLDFVSCPCQALSSEDESGMVPFLRTIFLSKNLVRKTNWQLIFQADILCPETIYWKFCSQNLVKKLLLTWDPSGLLNLILMCWNTSILFCPSLSVTLSKSSQNFSFPHNWLVCSHSCLKQCTLCIAAPKS